MKTFWQAIVLSLILTACVTAPSSSVYAPVAEQRREMAAAFAAQASMCFARQDTTNPVFHGCVDWHSSAHGAYALTTYQLYTGDARYAAQLDAAFDPAKLAEEVAHLHADQTFEMPYGRAWFLRLAVNWRRLHPSDHQLDALAQEAAESIVAHYEAAAPNPSTQEYHNPSWALVNVLHYARARSDATLAHRVEALVRGNFLEPRCDLASEQRGFIAVCTTWAWLVEETLPRAEFRTWYVHWDPGIETLTPVTTYSTAHDYGRNFSRAWGLYHLAEALDCNRLRGSYVAHVQAGYTPPERWRGEYMVNGHWVAQFGMLAIEPMFEEGAAVG